MSIIVNVGLKSAAYAFIALILPDLAHSQSDPIDFEMPEFQIPSDVQSDGSFRYSVELDLPDYRGLVPDLSISYSSSFLGHGAPEVWLGVGWQLGGLSSIERVTPGGGIPSFEDSRDIYRIDGMELLACSDGEASNPWPAGSSTYPADYRTNAVSASCLAGGNLAPLIEDFRKIERLETLHNGEIVHYFTVTHRNGTRYRYDSVGVLANVGLPSSHEHYDAAFERLFLLTEIRDAQAAANMVAVDYDFAPLSQGLAHRPSSIDYSQYSVEFHYAEQPLPIASFATGAQGFLGVQEFLLASVTISDGATGVRAYGIDYEPVSPLAAHRLAALRVFGSDYMVGQNGNIVSGSELPELVSNAVYTSEAAVFSTTTYPDTPFHAQVQPIDLDRDNRTELLFTGWQASTFTNSQQFGGVDTADDVPPLQASVVEFGTDRTISTQLGNDPVNTPDGGNTVPVSVFADLGSYQYGSPGCQGTVRRSILGFSGYVPSLDDNYFIYEYYNSNHRDSDSCPSNPNTDIDLNGISSGDSWNLNANYYNGLQFANLMEGPDPELMFGRRLYRLTANGPQQIANNQFLGDHAGLGAVIDIASTQPIDLNGDGVSELLAGPGAHNPHQFNRASLWCRLLNIGSTPLLCDGLDFDDGSTIQQNRNDFTWNQNNPGQPRDERRSFYFGDFNGDGARDLLILDAYEDQARELHISYGWGFGFGDRVLVADETTHPLLGFTDGEPFGDGQGSFDISSNIVRRVDSIRVVDINGDGLSDVVLIAEPDPDHDDTYDDLFDDGPGGPTDDEVATALQTVSLILLSTGNGFLEVDPTGMPDLLGVVAWADLDGDGLADAAMRGEDGVVLWNDAELPNLLTFFDTQLGSSIGVSYASSSSLENVGNELPSVLQVVASITRHDGRGQARQTTYSYVQAEYDYEYRRPLGFQSVTAHLPKLEGEVEGPWIVTTYANDELRERGLILSQTMIQNGVTWRQNLRSWDIRDAGLRPMRRFQASERTRLRYGSDLVEATTLFPTYSAYGNATRIQHLGLTENGVDLSPADNFVEARQFATYNTADYLVSLPALVTIQSGTGFNLSDTGRTLSSEFYVYEGNSTHHQTPSSPNVSVIAHWTGNLGNPHSQRNSASFTYDSYGNVLSQADGLGNTSVFTYDASRHLFRTSSANAAGHSEQVSWSFICQAPLQVTDANGLVTQFTYDHHCREIRRDDPNGNWQSVDWVNLGDPTLQFRQVTSLAPGTGAGNDEAISREYFDGLGQAYRVTVPADTEAQSSFIVTERVFDRRGNMTWESIPRFWSDAEAAGWNVAANERTQFVFDPLGRIETILAADGATNTLSYSVYPISAIPHPMVVANDAHCYDGEITTICGEVRLVADAQGNTIRRILADVDGTDVGGVGTDRVTEYDYDLLGRLVGVVDPIGATWDYQYDTYGNRTQSDDPALGLWTMVYDAADNLVLQTDALGQTTGLEYDLLNRVTRRTVTGAAATLVTTSTYDQPAPGEYNIGHLTELSNPDHTIGYGFDAAGNTVREEHSLLGRTYELAFAYRASGHLQQASLPNSPGGTLVSPAGEHVYDAAGQLRSFGSEVLEIDYNAYAEPTRFEYGNGTFVEHVRTEDMNRLRWIRLNNSAGLISEVEYDWTATGRIWEQEHSVLAQRFRYSYDYAGRLIEADNYGGFPQFDQTFSYDVAGSMVSNSHVGIYAYGLPSGPHPHAPTQVGGDPLTYDANGNMIVGPPIAPGFNGRVITYDGENRPYTVNHGGALTSYTYAADGARLLREDHQGRITATFGPVEIRNFGRPDEEVLTYPHPHIRVRNGAEVHYLHHDHLGSVATITDSAGAVVEDRHYAPFGEIAAATGGITPVETIGFIGERYDGDAGLQYLNARYYDPRLGLFIQPDWFEVTAPGVGTNRYSYSFNDPVNNLDRTGNACVPCVPVVLSALEALIAAVTIDTAADLLDNGVADGSMGTGLAAATQEAVEGFIQSGIASPMEQGENGEQSQPFPDRNEPSERPQEPRRNFFPDLADFEDPENVPSPWEWRGGGERGGREGAWHNPETGESLHDDRTHPTGRDPHWTYTDEDGQRWEVYDDDRDNWESRGRK